jgi:hypothetical protein
MTAATHACWKTGGCALKKSQTKQALLSVLFGPAGLFYCSANAALLLTLLTLVAVLFAAQFALYIIAASFISSVVCGALLVVSHNKLTAEREYVPSTYIGRVSCRVIGKNQFKRDYSRPLAQAIFKRKAKLVASYGLATACLVITAYIALPKAKTRLDTLNNNGEIQHVLAANEPATYSGGDTAAATGSDGLTETLQIAAAKPHHTSLSNIGVWQVYPDEGEYSFKAKLLGNHYQNTSEGYYRPTLTLSCDSGHAIISFDAFEVLGTESASLTLLFDTRPEQSFNWRLQGDYRRAFSAASKPLLKNLSRSRSLQISYRPFGSEKERSIDFDLGKSSTITSQLNKQCA